MYCVKKITDDISWIGGNDRRLALFENVFPVERGVSYNSYFLSDEKTVLLDTVDRSVGHLFFENLAHVLKGRPLDYVVINHMHPSKTEWAMLCSHCRERYYPQIAPCIIVAIRRDDTILLAQHTRHRNGVHTVLAGFVEVGETLEQAVAREVMEESGIKVKNLRYVTSQPWPFPQSLMTAFMAEYDSGEIVIDQKELLEANWYRYDDLPLLPPPGTVARRLIEDTVAMCRADDE